MNFEQISPTTPEFDLLEDLLAADEAFFAEQEAGESLDDYDFPETPEY